MRLLFDALMQAKNALLFDSMMSLGELFAQL